MTALKKAISSQTNATILVYLSLFLLLLVFFIVLNAHSVLRGHRIRAALDSVGQSFAPVPGGGVQEERPLPGSPAAIALSRLRALGELFETEIGVVKVEKPGKGRLMVVSMQADELFLPGSPVLRNAHMGLMDRVARALADRSNGVRFEVDFLIAFGNEATVKGPHADPVARAASFARTLIADGAPADAVSVGLEPGPGGSLRMLFSGHAATAGAGHATP